MIISITDPKLFFAVGTGVGIFPAPFNYKWEETIWKSDKEESKAAYPLAGAGGLDHACGTFVVTEAALGKNRVKLAVIIPFLTMSLKEASVLHMAFL